MFFSSSTIRARTQASPSGILFQTAAVLLSSQDLAGAIQPLFSPQAPTPGPVFLLADGFLLLRVVIRRITT